MYRYALRQERIVLKYERAAFLIPCQGLRDYFTKSQFTTQKPLQACAHSGFISLSLLLSHILNGEADSTHLILAQAYYCYYVSQGQDIFYTVDSLLSDLGDVYHAFLTGCEFDECTELLDAYYLALEDLTFLEVSCDDPGAVG